MIFLEYACKFVFAYLAEALVIEPIKAGLPDSFYTPLIMAKLVGPELSVEDREQMQAHIDEVMTSRYRMMVWHSGIEFENPYGVSSG